MRPKTSFSPTLYNCIRDLICTSRPYYALQNLQQLTDSIFQCEITVENYRHPEHSIISTAEAGRHLAILGSCVLAASNPLKCKHYYLATGASLERSDDVACIDPTVYHKPIRLVCRAELQHLDKKSGSVITSIYTREGLSIYELRIDYKVMTADLFGKLFKAYAQDNTAPVPNPYSMPIPLFGLSHNDREMHASLGIIAKEQCTGHFDHCPALPVAVLSSALLDLAGRHLRHICKDEALKYSTHHASLNADRLAFAGEEVFLKSSFVESFGDRYTFAATAENVAGSIVGRIETTFEIHS